jgi:hypothetical protein
MDGSERRMMPRPDPQRIPIAVRAYGKSGKPRRLKKWARRQKGRQAGASRWSLAWDVETLSVPAQPLRVGAYQVRNDGQLVESGLFYDEESLSASDLETLREYNKNRRLQLRTRADFIDQVFFPVLVDLRGTSITYNGAFDYGRLAIDHGPALSPSYRGGFWLAFNRDPRRPHLQIRHLSGAESLLRFTAR